MGTPIKREDIRKGDTIRRVMVDEFEADHDYTRSAKNGETYELVKRPIPLPTVPGVYLDRQGDVWRLKASRFLCLSIDGFDDVPNEFAPFTLLRPVAEVSDEVLAGIIPLVERSLTDISPDGPCNTRDISRARRTLALMVEKHALK